MYTNIFYKKHMVEKSWFFIGTLTIVGLVLLIIRMFT